jgi:hypothetical protein
MPYKFNTKLFSMKERHPISKVRFESAAKLIQNQRETGESSEVEMFAKVRHLWELKKQKVWQMP